jgi:hypothetical protein
MGRKRTAEDYHRTAEENGWVPGAYEEGIAYSKRRMSLARDINRTSRKP